MLSIFLEQIWIVDITKQQHLVGTSEQSNAILNYKVHVKY